MARRPHDAPGDFQHRARILERALTEGRAALRSQADRHAPQQADADDAMQEACLQFLRYYDGPPGEAALRWLMLCVKHRGWQIAKRRRTRESFDGVGATDAYDPRGPLLNVRCERPDPAERTEREQDVAGFFSALGRLKPDERTALLLLGLGYSYREIAESRGWTQTKVNRCISEGRAALREMEQR
jgi:RNA polymerase sigma factor (sigma-70 family)